VDLDQPNVAWVALEKVFFCYCCCKRPAVSSGGAALQAGTLRGGRAKRCDYALPGCAWKTRRGLNQAKRAGTCVGLAAQRYAVDHGFDLALGPARC